MAKTRRRKKIGRFLLSLPLKNKKLERFIIQKTRRSITPVQLWIIGVGAIFTRVNDLPSDQLGDYSLLHNILYRRNIRETLRDSWSSENRGQLIEAIEGLRLYGHRHDCYRDEIRSLQSQGQALPPIDKNRYLAWDHCRIVQLYRWGYILGWFEREWCWDQMLDIAREVQAQYTSWEDMADAYLRGRILWAGERLPNHHEFEEAAEWLKSNAVSPWRRVDWNFPLKKDW